MNFLGLGNAQDNINLKIERLEKQLKSQQEELQSNMSKNKRPRVIQKQLDGLDKTLEELRNAYIKRHLMAVKDKKYR